MCIRDRLLSNIQLIERHLNPRLSVSTILLTMYDSRTNLANQVVDDVRAHFPEKVLNTVIPRSVRISEAPSYGPVSYTHLDVYKRQVGDRGHSRGVPHPVDGYRARP